MSLTPQKMVSKVVRVKPQSFEWEIQDFHVFMSEPQAIMMKTVDFVAHPFKVCLVNDSLGYKTPGFFFQSKFHEVRPDDYCMSRLFVTAKFSDKKEPLAQLEMDLNGILFNNYYEEHGDFFTLEEFIPLDFEVAAGVSLVFSCRLEQIVHETKVEDNKNSSVEVETIEDELELQSTQGLESIDEGALSGSNDSDWDLIDEDENNGMESVGDVESVCSLEPAFEGSEVETAIEESEVETAIEDSEVETAIEDDSTVQVPDIPSTAEKIRADSMFKTFVAKCGNINVYSESDSDSNDSDSDFTESDSYSTDSDSDFTDSDSDSDSTDSDSDSTDSDSDSTDSDSDSTDSDSDSTDSNSDSDDSDVSESSRNGTDNGSEVEKKGRFMPESKLDRLTTDYEKLESQHQDQMANQQFYESIQTRQRMHEVLKAINTEKLTKEETSNANGQDLKENVAEKDD